MFLEWHDARYQSRCFNISTCLIPKSQPILTANELKQLQYLEIPSGFRYSLPDSLHFMRHRIRGKNLGKAATFYDRSLWHGLP